MDPRRRRRSPDRSVRGAVGDPGIAHRVSTRPAHRCRRVDPGPAGQEAEAVRRPRANFMIAAAFAEASAVILRQAHGAIVIDAPGSADARPTADGVYRASSSPSPAIPAVRTADCVALLIADPRSGAAAAVHAGWRGTAAGIAANAVERFGREGAGALVVAMGPAIGGCCYEVGDEVVRALSLRTPGRSHVFPDAGGGRARVDLRAANAAQLVAAGVRPEAIHAAPWCTRCRNDLFFSVRAEGPAAG